MPRKKTLDQWLEALNQDKIDLGLTRIKTVIAKLKLQPIAPHTVIVGGTNGKGSTVAMLSALGRAAGLRVGAFTSPHLYRYNERMAIDGKPVDDARIVAAFESIDAARGEVPLSYFEYATLAAAWIFKQEKVDLAVLEVGLGGRLDATNAFDADVAVITTVDLDHSAWLGDTRELIGAEKAAILRPERPLIFAGDDCPQSVLKAARAGAAELLRRGQEYHIKASEDGFDLYSEAQQWQNLSPPSLPGAWQRNNAAAAILAMHHLGLDLSREVINRALQNTELACRIQRVSQAPEVIYDVAHNRESATALAAWLRENPVPGQTRAVFAVLRDKQVEQWVGELDAVVDHWFISASHSHRALPTRELLLILVDHVRLISAFDDLASAHRMARACSAAEDRIVVFGSFHNFAELGA